MKSTTEIIEDRDNIVWWYDINVAIPAQEDYYTVKYEDGTQDEKPFRKQLSKGILGFMCERKITHWRRGTKIQDFEID